MRHTTTHAAALLALALCSCSNDEPLTNDYSGHSGLAPRATNVAPNADVTIDAIITITGERLDSTYLRSVRIGDEAVSGVKTVAVIVRDSFLTASSTEVSFKLPIDAPDGEIFLAAQDDMLPNVATGIRITVAKPTVTSINPSRTLGVKGGDTLTITGSHLNAVRNIEIGGLRLTAPTTDSTYTTLSAVCPSEVTGGALVLVCYNGYKLQVEGGQFDNLAAKVKITTLSTTLLDPMALSQSSVIINGEHLNAVTNAYIDDYELGIDPASTPDRLTVWYGNTVTEGTLRLQTSNGTEVKFVEPMVYKPLAPTLTHTSTGIFTDGYYHLEGTYLKSVTKLTLGGNNILSDDFLVAEHDYLRIAAPENLSAGSTLPVKLSAYYASTGSAFTVDATVKVYEPISTAYTIIDFDGNPASITGTEDIAQSMNGTSFGAVHDETMSSTQTAYFTRGNRPTGLNSSDFIFSLATLSFALSVDKNLTTADAELRWNIAVAARDTLTNVAGGDSIVLLTYNYSAAWKPNERFDVEGGWIRVDVPLSAFGLHSDLTTSKGVLPKGTPITEDDMKRKTFVGITLRTADNLPTTAKVSLRLDDVAFVSGQ